MRKLLKKLFSRKATVYVSYPSEEVVNIHTSQKVWRVWVSSKYLGMNFALVAATAYDAERKAFMFILASKCNAIAHGDKEPNFIRFYKTGSESAAPV